MSMFRIKGGRPLNGEIVINGAKNAALPLLAATLLSDQTSILRNMPRIRDVDSLIKLIEALGANVEWTGESELTVDAAKLENKPLDHDLVRSLRASILLVGPLLARFGEVKLPYPGGCLLGKRPLDAHFRSFELLGAEVEREDGSFHVSSSGLTGTRMFMSEASVTATENAIMAAARAEGVTVIKNAASEPHVENLTNALSKAGVQITGSGTNTLTIHGIGADGNLDGLEIDVVPDILEVGAFAALGLATQSNLTLKQVYPDQLDPIMLKFEEMGALVEVKGEDLLVRPSEHLQAFSIKTNVWPGFPTDLQAPFSALATQCQGQSLIHDWMYEGRLFYFDKLHAMGASILMCDPHRVIINGPTKLRGKEIESPDIRAGMAMVIAALCASGESMIHQAQFIERGYQDIDKRLRAVGAEIKRID